MNSALRHSAAHVFVESLEAPTPDPTDVHHLFRVLRLRDGEVVTVSDGAGGWRPMVVAGGALEANGEIVREPPPVQCTIATAIPKGDRVEWMVQKLTELGVSEIVFLHCVHSVVRWDVARAAKQLERLARIAREASAQSRRVWLPVLRGPISFDEAAALPGAVLADPDGPEVLRPSGISPLVVLIGPEGGFHQGELSVSMLRRRLVDNVLRVETAAVAAASVILTYPS